MISVQEAWQLVVSEARTLGARIVPLEEARGLILAEDVVADRDSPAADKSLVDGYAIRAADFDQGIRRFALLEQITAGMVPTRSVAPGTATQIMTGAPIPHGADAVVMVEQSRPDEREPDHYAVLFTEHVRAGQNIMRQGASMQRGQSVLRSGHEIRAIEMGLLAEVGQHRVRVIRRPTVAVLSTGNELVPYDRTPGPGQLRNSNGPMLKGLAEAMGATALDLGSAADQESELRRKVDAGLECDVLVLSGGVSAGVLDLVPSVLAAQGVRQVFHKVHFKPGKPIWFGVKTHSDRHTLVFGLPGNPVSSLVCFELFVRPALRQLAGRTPSISADTIRARLATPFVQKSDRPTYFPVRVEGLTTEPTAHLLQWQGSADLRTLAEANGLAFFDGGHHTFQAGESVDVVLLGVTA